MRQTCRHGTQSSIYNNGNAIQQSSPGALGWALPFIEAANISAGTGFGINLFTSSGSGINSYYNEVKATNLAVFKCPSDRDIPTSNTSTVGRTAPVSDVVCVGSGTGTSGLPTEKNRRSILQGE